MHSFLKFGLLLSEVSAISSLYLRLSYFEASTADCVVFSVARVSDGTAFTCSYCICDRSHGFGDEFCSSQPENSRTRSSSTPDKDHAARTKGSMLISFETVGLSKANTNSP